MEQTAQQPKELRQYWTTLHFKIDLQHQLQPNSPLCSKQESMVGWVGEWASN